MSSLFDNPMVKLAAASLSQEDKDRYKNIGKEMYNNIDYEKGIINPEQNSNIAYVKCQLDSGMHPSYLEEGEVYVMEQYLGKEWYTQWGYVAEDLKNIVTLTPVKK